MSVIYLDGGGILSVSFHSSIWKFCILCVLYQTHKGYIAWNLEPRNCMEPGASVKAALAIVNLI